MWWTLGLMTALAAPTPADHVDVLVSAQIRALMKEVEALRGLKFAREVPVSVELPEAIRAETLEDLAEPDAQESIASMGHTLTAFHMAPRGYDIPAMYTAIMGESLGGYYDPEEERLVLVQHADMFSQGGLVRGTEETTTATHELVHALQDQHFHLLDLNDRETEDDDVDLAISSLIEGDASLAMYLLDSDTWIRNMKPGERETLAKAMSGESNDAPESAFGKAPRIVRESMLFPYSRGLAFAIVLWQHGSWARLDQAFGAVPLSSEQILHPDKYLRRPDWPIRLKLEDVSPALGDGWSTADINTLGEAGIRSWLRDSPCALDARVDEAATGWGGDRYAVLVGPQEAHTLAWATTWDSAADAAQAEAAFMCAVGHIAGVTGGPAWSHGGLSSRVVREGKDVLVVLDAPAGGDEALLARLRNLPRHRFDELDDIAPPRKEEPADEAKEAAPTGPAERLR